MVPDDPGAIRERELRFRFGSYHVIVAARPDGTWSVQVMDSFYVEPDQTITKQALASTLKLLSVTRKWVFEAYQRAGGTVKELRALMADDENL